jgi:hypothetical protein
MARSSTHSGDIQDHQLDNVRGGADGNSGMTAECVSQGEWLGEGVRSFTFGVVGAGLIEAGLQIPYVKRAAVAGKVGARVAAYVGLASNWGANTAESVARTGAKTAWFNHVCAKKQ